MNNLVVDKPERIDSDIEGFKIEAVEKEKNLTSARIRVCRHPMSHEPVVFYTQELIRNFKNINDPLSRRHIIKAFSPSQANAAPDTALEFKLNDAVLAHQRRIDDYSPLTDIHSNEMNLFIDDESAMYLSDVGIDVDRFGEEFCNVESVEATPFMVEVANGVQDLKRQLSEIAMKRDEVKKKMLDEMGINFVGTEDQFGALISQHNLPDKLVQHYLIVTEQHRNLKAQLDEANEAVFSETKTMIKLPAKKDGLCLYTFTSPSVECYTMGKGLRSV